MSISICLYLSIYLPIYLSIYLFTIFNSLQLSFFMSVLHGVLTFYYHFNSLLLTFITGFCSGIPCSSVLHFVETSYLIFIAVQLTGCHVMWHLGAGNSETDDKQSYICVYVGIYMCVFICMYI